VPETEATKPKQPKDAPKNAPKPPNA